MSTDRRSGASAGFATVWAVIWTTVLVLVGWVCLLVAGLVARQHQLDGAADLVALSAASRAQRGGDGCEAAAEIAAANHVSLVTCWADGIDVVVEVSDKVDLPFGISGRLAGHARAGPER